MNQTTCKLSSDKYSKKSAPKGFRARQIPHKTLILILLSLFVNLLSGPVSRADRRSEADRLSGNRDLSQQVIENIRAETIAQADKMMSEKPVTVTAASCKRSAGGIHDF